MADATKRTEKQKMLAGELYHAGDPELIADHQAALAWMDRYNAAAALPATERHAILVERLAKVGAGAVIRPPFHCDYGYSISLGDGVFLNSGCIILDVAAVTIGDGTQIGPGVQILTADHPRDPAERATGAEWGRAITIGRNVWIGGGALILPGVTDTPVTVTSRDVTRQRMERRPTRERGRWREQQRGVRGMSIDDAAQASPTALLI